MNLNQFIKKNSIDNYISYTVQKKAANIFNLSFRDVEKAALKQGIVPLRYKRNQSTIDISAQKVLFNSHVAIIGCGGLGGYIAEILTRLGVGKLTIFDFDVFEEHNLNRQNFSNIENTGKEKVLVVKKALEKINPAIKIIAFSKKFDPQTDFILINKANVVVDAVDNPDTKLKLADICKKNSINFVHGAVAGMSGQFITNNTLENFYRNTGKGVETIIGTPAFSVTFAASIQSVEIIKLLLSINNKLDNKLLICDLSEYEFLLFSI
jgi:molybdopterin/thiamine biosynthesis adenylyltransferase